MVVLSYVEWIGQIRICFKPFLFSKKRLILAQKGLPFFIRFASAADKVGVHSIEFCYISVITREVG